MARVSLDDGGSGPSTSSSKSKASTRASKPEKSGGSAAPGGKLDSKQKVKAIGAVSVIVLAGVFIAWQLGLFGSGGGEVDPGITEEQVRAYNEQVQREEREQRENATRMEAPVGAN